MVKVTHKDEQVIYVGAVHIFLDNLDFFGNAVWGVFNCGNLNQEQLRTGVELGKLVIKPLAQLTKEKALSCKVLIVSP